MLFWDSASRSRNRSICSAGRLAAPGWPPALPRRPGAGRGRGRPSRSRVPGRPPGRGESRLGAFGQPGVDHLGQAAQLSLDGLGLADEGHQDAILGALLVDEIMAEDLGARLELAVDPPVALLHPAGVPGHVEMEEVPAVGLEVQALAGRVGGDQDAERMLGRVGVEGELDGLPLVMRRRAVEDRDPVVGAVGPVDRGRELLMEIALGVVVLGEDDDPRVVPGAGVTWWWSSGARSPIRS